MKTLCVCTLEIEFDEKKFSTFEQFIDLKKEMDTFFMTHEISLEKIPNLPSPSRDYANYEFTIEYQSAQFIAVVDKANQLKLNNNLKEKGYWGFHFEFKFLKKEMNETPLLSMKTYNNFYAADIKHPSECGTRYEKTFVCPNCGSVFFKQISPLSWDTAQMKKNLLMGVPDDRYLGGYSFMITEKLANIFKSRGLTGYTLEPVTHTGKPGKEIKCFQMIIHHVMPSLSEVMPVDIGEDECTDCQRLGQIRFPLHYEQSSLEGIKDFNLSLETSNGRGRNPFVLISQEVKGLFHDLKIKPMYKPIIIVEKE